MNKKGKNKKGKVPVPNTQEEKSGDKTEDLGVFGDLVDTEKPSDVLKNVEEKAESVKEERVPEIVGEVIALPVDVKDEETPKKPKRNRGKKKKGKEDDFEDHLEEDKKETDRPPVEEIIPDIVEVKKEPEDDTAVTPTARKKKNKKKTSEHKTEELSSLEPMITAPEPPENIVKEPITEEIKSEVTAKQEPVEHETKASKKKNKKKKRNDSERSEREEITCTSAFQKLIDTKDEPSESKPEAKVDEGNVMSLEKCKPEKPIQPQKDLILQEIITPAEMPPVKAEESHEVSEGKGKKKNKKDKKHIPKPEESVPSPQESSIEPQSLAIEKESPIEDIIKEVPEVGKPECLVEELIPKPKAKIAKPVEKKRKGKQDNQSVENIQQEIDVPISLKLEEDQKQALFDSPDTIKAENPEDKVIEKEATTDTETRNIQQELPVTLSSVIGISSDMDQDLSLEEFEPLNIPDKTVGKKRKKGQKTPKTPDVSFEIVESKSDILSTTESNDDIKPVKISSETFAATKDEGVSASGKSELLVEVDTAKELPSQSQSKKHILLTPELTEGETSKTETLFSEKPDKTHKSEAKPGKKRKKSPKPSKNVEEIQKNDDVVTKSQDPIEESSTNQGVTKEMGEKIDASNITRMYDIEISSIKADESEGSVCDTIPDITYPRASSQQLSEDNNNNTVIREIFPVQEIITDTLLQDNMKPSKTDEATKGKETSPKEEKTDLKSKMMEVNQDMEELRLSIERSLAELTAIEKSEDVIEKQFEESKIKTDECIPKITDAIAIQKDDNDNKMLEISDAEKTVIEKPIEVGNIASTKDTKKEIEDLLLSIDNKPKDKKSKNIKKEKHQKVDAHTEPTIIEASKSQVKCEVTQQEPKYVPSLIETIVDPILPMTIEEKLTSALITSETGKPFIKQKLTEEVPPIAIPFTLPEEKKSEQQGVEEKETQVKSKEEEIEHDTPPVCPARKDNKNKHKKKKGKQDSQVTAPQSTQSAQSTSTQSSTSQESKKEEKTESKTENKSDSKDNQEKGKQQASNLDSITEKDLFSDMDYEPIEKFEDALTSSVDDVNKSFEMIVQESQEQFNPTINIIAPDEEKTPVSPSKNLLGHPDIPAPSNKRDYKKEKDKIPNEIAAEVNIKDTVDVERKQSKNTQTISKLKELNDCKLSDNEEFVYKYSFRKVFLQSCCHVCKKDLAGARVACCYCNLVFYCGIKHKDDDWPQHQALCFAVSTIGHLKDQKHIYGDAKNLTGHDYRLIRMQMIVSCEKVLKRRLVPWEQEALLYPRICAYVPCREWRQMKLSDCQGCGQISYCTEHPDHYPKSHSRWCKSYSLYNKLVCYQQTKGRLEPKLPTKVMQGQYEIPDKINEVLAGMYEEKIDINDIQYAALTQLATAPLTTAYCDQLVRNKSTSPNGYKKSTFTIHVVGAELQFEADALNKWEIFFLHLRPDLQELKVVLINYNLNPSNLPLELLGKIKLCDHCRQNKRRVLLDFQDKRTYADYKSSEDFVVPDIVCAFNPSIQRSSVYNGKDPWPSAVNVILKQKIPFIITAYTITELRKDCIRIKECTEIGYNFISEPKYNNFASVRPDRNFISDDDMPLLFKNYCFAIICG